jgi:hypothetical protein
MHRLEYSKAGLIEKIAYKTDGPKNRLQDKTKNRPQDAIDNRHDIINPVCLCGVVDEAGLKGLLSAKGQVAWCSRVRLFGLLLLIDYICRNVKPGGTISISSDLAHSFVSKIRRRDHPGTITEPLQLLCAIGVLRKVQQPYLKCSVRESLASHT